MLKARQKMVKKLALSTAMFEILSRYSYVQTGEKTASNLIFFRDFHDFTLELDFDAGYNKGFKVTKTPGHSFPL